MCRKGRVCATPTPRRRGLLSTQRAKRVADLGCEQVRLLPGGEVAAFVDRVEVHDVRVARVDPAARRPPDLARQRGDGDWDRRGREVRAACGGAVGPGLL